MAYTRMRYHFVFATKGRKRWIDEEIEGFLYQIICRQFQLNDGAVVTIGGIEDHVHVVAGIRPTVAVTDVIKAVKRDSAKAVRRNFKHRRSFKWQVSFGGFTACPYDMQELIDYVDNQKEHHKNETMIKKYELLLEKCTEDEEKSASGADCADESEKEDGADGAEKKEKEREEGVGDAIRG